MKYVEFAKNTVNANLSPCYLIEGEDAFFRAAAVDKLISAANLTKTDVNYSRFDKESFGDFLQSLDLFPLMAEKRMSVIFVETLSDGELKRLNEYALNPNLTTVAAVVNSGEKKLALKNYQIIDCSKESLPIIKRWISLRLKKDGFTIDSAAAETLAERMNRDMSSVSNAVEMLASYKLGASEITDKDVELLVPDEVEAEVFSLINAIVDKNSVGVFTLLNKIKMRKADESKVTSLLYGNYRRMFFAVTSDLSEEEIAKGLNVKPYSITKAKQLAKKYSKIKLKKSLEILAEAEMGQKSGMKISADALTDLVLKLFNL